MFQILFAYRLGLDYNDIRYSIELFHTVDGHFSANFLMESSQNDKNAKDESQTAESGE